MEVFGASRQQPAHLRHEPDTDISAINDSHQQRQEQPAYIPLESSFVLFPLAFPVVPSNIDKRY